MPFSGFWSQRRNDTYTAVGHVLRELLGSHSSGASERKDGGDGELHCEIAVVELGVCVMRG
jgi:hypothetical protein